MRGKFLPYAHSINAVKVDQSMAYRIGDERGRAMDVQRAHDVGAMSLGGLYAYAKSDGDFLAALAFGEQLNDFTLTRSEAVARGSGGLHGSGALGEIVKEHIGGARGEEGLGRTGFGRPIVGQRRESLHRELMHFLELPDELIEAAPAPLYAVSYRARRRPDDLQQLELWPELLALDSPLPTMPLWISEQRAVPVELEATYQSACRGLRMPS